MSIIRKLSLILLFIVVAGISTWLRFGDLEAPKRWLANRPAPKAEAPVAAAPQEEILAFHQSFAGVNAASRDSVMVLHFRRPDSSEETMAKAVVKVIDGQGNVRKEISAWGVFRHDTAVGASIARFAVGTFPPGEYRVSADLGSRQSLGVRRAAIEFSASDAEPVWADLNKVK
ncbi:hypothetical protein CU669_16470 [Paramagnetospirillum kuznetsovii]|uniref:Uncharacterized protein n=1 Tax=Paramagnetospirillum kuznetsovii TaxID=2053833 RepID=A0A364NUV8_9PROT|nr:hypothetical protein [Paramagnetospirillum kuznetsovii]RAU20864.1 hypothetical protein CU669_16470 [Paramagnetospirillum kuznetsovii]